MKQSLTTMQSLWIMTFRVCTMASRLHDSILWLLHACAILRNRAYNFQEQQGGALTKTAPEKHSFAEAFAMQQHEHGIYIHDTTPLYDENSDHA